VGHPYTHIDSVAYGCAQDLVDTVQFAAQFRQLLFADRNASVRFRVGRRRPRIVVQTLIGTLAHELMPPVFDDYGADDYRSQPTFVTAIITDSVTDYMRCSMVSSRAVFAPLKREENGR